MAIGRARQLLLDEPSVRSSALARSNQLLGLAWVMTIFLYDLSVPTFLQTMRAVSGFLDRAAKHCAETGADDRKA